MAKKTKTTKPFMGYQTPAPLAILERGLTPLDVERQARYGDSVLMDAMNFALSRMRPHKGSGEAQMLNYIYDFATNQAGVTEYGFDSVGNLHVDMRDHAQGSDALKSRSLFVAHVDTVHRQDGDNDIRKTPSVWYASGSQLGADDGSGIAILMHMMAAGVRGYYVFTVGEECGGIGASVVGRDTALLMQFDRAVAFDRRGTTSVISHQGCGRCCSDTFAESLSDALNAQGLLMMPDDTGVYTDTAEFVDVIPECTNISVGYKREHSTEEAQDMLFLYELADAVIAIDWEALPTERDIEAQAREEAQRWASVRSNRKYDYSEFGDVARSGAAMHSEDIGSWGSLSAWDSEFDTDDAVLAGIYEHEVQEALLSAMEGDTTHLIECMAEAVFPEDTTMAETCIRRYRFDEDVLDDAYEQLVQGGDPDQILIALYDAVATA